MRKSKFSESQIVAILKEADSGIPVAEVLRHHAVRSGRANLNRGISGRSANLTAWKAEIGSRKWQDDREGITHRY